MAEYIVLINRLRRCEQFKCRGCEYEQAMGCRAKLNEDAAEAIEELIGRVKVLEKVADKWCKAVPKWTRVKNGLPKNDELKIVAIKDEHGDNPYIFPTVGWYLEKADCWIVDNECRSDVYAWMPLPEPPKEKQE